jgi:hypothetical protein
MFDHHFPKSRSGSKHAGLLRVDWERGPVRGPIQHAALVHLLNHLADSHALARLAL